MRDDYEMENDIKILYEDNHLIVAVKPQNIPSQKDPSGDPDILSLLKSYIKEKYSKPGEAYIGLIHRLDRPTGGVMVFARTSKAASRLSAQIKNGRFEKRYLAVLKGSVPEAGTLTDWLKKDRETNTVSISDENDPAAKKAVLEYSIKEKADGLTLADIKLETGRSHQIRVQFANIGAPIYGDRRYGGGETDADLCLWSYSLSFDHPTTKERLSFTSYPPAAYPWSEFNL